MLKVLLPVFFLITSLCYSQDFWEPYEVPNDSPILGFSKAQDGTLYATGFGLYRSTDRGSNWTSPGTFTYENSKHVFEELSSPLKEIFAVNDSTIIAGCYDGPIFLSNDKGVNWTPIMEVQNIRSFAFDSNGIIYAGTGYNFNVSTDMGKTWFHSPDNSCYISELRVIDNKVYAGTMRGIYLITKSDSNWVLNYGGMTDSLRISTFAVKSNIMYAGNDLGIYKSTDMGKTWSKSSIAPDLRQITDLEVAANGDIYAGTNGSGLWTSSDDGSTWQRSSLLPAVSPVYEIDIYGNEIYIASIGVYSSTDNGTNWTHLNKGLGYGVASKIVFDNDNTAYAITFKGLLRKDENSSQWEDISSSMPASLNDLRDFISDKKNNLYLYSRNNIFLSTDKGNSWTDINTSKYQIYQLKANSKGDIFVTNSSDSLFLLNNNKLEFIRKFFLTGPMYFGTRDEIIIPSYMDTMYISRDNGKSWEASHKGGFTNSGNSYPYSMAITDSSIFAVNLTGYDVYRSTDWGETWTEANKNIEDLFEERELVNIGNDVYLTTFMGIYKFNYATGAWDDFNFGLPKVRSQILTLDRDNRLYMASKVGTFRSKDPVPVPTSVDETILVKDNDKVYPNPSHGMTKVILDNAAPGSEYSARVCNALGETVLNLNTGAAEGSEVTISFNAESLASGTYFVVFTQSGRTRTVPFVVNK